MKENLIKVIEDPIKSQSFNDQFVTYFAYYFIIILFDYCMSVLLL